MRLLRGIRILIHRKPIHSRIFILFHFIPQWSRSLEKPLTGSIYKLAWSSDGTQLAGACANGKVIFAHVVERSVEYGNFRATITEKKSVTVHDVLTDSSELLDVPERVIQLSMRYSYLVLTTPRQCYIYNSTNWNTPTIFDLKDGSVILLIQCEKFVQFYSPQKNPNKK